MRLLLAFFIAIAALAAPLAAQDRSHIGTGRLFTNDKLGDGDDRWRTGSYVFSHLRGTDRYTGQDLALGDVLEYRLRSEILAPVRGANDRPYVGLIALGLHSQMAQGPLRASVGADVSFIGPQTGVADFQEAFHDAFSLPRVPSSNQIGNDTILGALGEASYVLRVTDRVTARPFVEAQIGTEDLRRVGGDIVIGAVSQDDILLRDVVTGQLYAGTNTGATGASLIVGADIAQVASSAYLPASDGYVVSQTRSRARAGVNWVPYDGLSLFYGATYLSEEFEGQPEGQVVGSLRAVFAF